MLGRALGNLADNAVRHGDGPITLTAAALDADPAPAVVLTVHDDGPGMPPAFLPHAAERFHRSDAARTRGGNGLGLALVDAITHAHHGQLRICANGAHHHQPAADPRWARHRCTHPTTGTTISLLLPTGGIHPVPVPRDQVPDR
ncbi:sensor histidine kinase (plasmid) [Rhodococcus sp. ZPP]|nr:sensor histidine kinase [Rhodococcus sp. ZPP]